MRAHTPQITPQWGLPLLSLGKRAALEPKRLHSAPTALLLFRHYFFQFLSVNSGPHWPSKASKYTPAHQVDNWLCSRSACPALVSHHRPAWCSPAGRFCVLLQPRRGPPIDPRSPLLAHEPTCRTRPGGGHQRYWSVASLWCSRSPLSPKMSAPVFLRLPRSA